MFSILESRASDQPLLLYQQRSAQLSPSASGAALHPARPLHQRSIIWPNPFASGAASSLACHYHQLSSTRPALPPSHVDHLDTGSCYPNPECTTACPWTTDPTALTWCTWPCHHDQVTQRPYCLILTGRCDLTVPETQTCHSEPAQPVNSGCTGQTLST